MRFALLLAALAALAACASTPQSPGTPPAPSTATTQQPSRVLQLLGNAGRENAPTRQDVERLLGEPDIARQDGAGAALTYRYENCALLLLFASDQRNTLRLAQANPGARRAGETAPSLEQCAAEAGARRS
jgi:hypothetical protein